MLKWIFGHSKINYMVLEYKLKAILDENKKKEAEKACDEGFEAMQNLIVTTARVLNKGFGIVVIVWFLSRFYKKTITKESIKYNLYLLN